MILTSENASKVRLFAGLYMRTKKQTRFWGWGSCGWGSLRAAESERPWAGLAAWLRQAHARLDHSALEGPAPAKLDNRNSPSE